MDGARITFAQILILDVRLAGQRSVGQKIIRMTIGLSRGGISIAVHSKGGVPTPTRDLELRCSVAVVVWGSCGASRQTPKRDKGLL
eukprot:gene24591-biopygen10119